MYVEKTDQGFNIMNMTAGMFKAVLRSIKQAAEFDKQMQQVSKLMEREQNAVHRPGRDLQGN